MNEKTINEVIDIAPWWINYAEGIPKFADEYKKELLNLSTKDRLFVNTIALATAFTLKSPDLLHDISQTMFDDNLVSTRDDIIAMAANAHYDYITKYNYIITASDPADDTEWLDMRVRSAVAIALRYDKSVTSAHAKANIPMPAEFEDIRNLVALITIIIKLL